MIAFPAPALPGLYLLAALAQCPPAPPPEVTADFISNAPRILYDRTAAELDGMGMDSAVSHAPGEVFIVGGLTESFIESGMEVLYDTLTDPGGGQGCIWPGRVVLKIVYSPVVRIAAENQPGSCQHEQTLQHELRHVNTDVITLKEYAARLEAAVRAAAQDLRPAGPMDIAALEHARAGFADPLRAALDRGMAETDRVRRARQRQIDTRQEYLRLDGACRGR